MSATRHLLFLTLLTLLLVLGCHASLLRSQTLQKQQQQDNRQLDMSTLELFQVGCPKKTCFPVAYFQGLQPNVLEQAQCRQASDCELGYSCRYVPGQTFKCEVNAQQDVQGSVCDLECVTSTNTRAGVSTPASGCNDVKTCHSLSDIIDNTNNPSLMNSPECTKTQDCPNGECRYYTGGSIDMLKCDDTAGMYCGYPCVDDDRTMENENIGTENTSSSISGVARSNPSSVYPCSGPKTCWSLVDISTTETQNPNLIASGECTKKEDCPGNGECRFDLANDALVCDNVSGTYCAYNCVDDDRQTKNIP